MRIIGDGAEYRKDEYLQKNRKRDAQRKERLRGDRAEKAEIENRAVVSDRRLGQCGDVGRQQRAGDGCAEGRVGSVVHGPAEDFAFVVNRC